MFKQCKNCHANMPEEANICLECLTLYEEKHIEKSSLSNGKNSSKSIWLYAPVWAIITICVCLSVSGLSTKFGELKPALIEASEYYENEESTDHSAGNNNNNSANNMNSNSNNHSNDSNHTGSNTNSHTQQTEASQSSTSSDSNTANRPSKTLSTSSSIFSDIKVNPVSKPANTSSSSSENSTSGNASSENNSSGNAASGNSSSNNSSTNDKNNNTTNKPNSSNNQTTNKPASNGTTSNTNNSNTTNPPAVSLEYDKFEHYIDSDGRLHISKYTGSSKNVIVPDKLNNKDVYRIDAGTFKDNSKIETITFKNSVTYHTLWIQTYAIDNCSSLRKITFPRNTDLGILNQFARNCQRLSVIDIDNWQYEFVNGGLYYWNTNTWSLYYYCEGFPSEEFRPATFFRASVQSSLFDYCRNVKRFYLNDANTLSGFNSTSTSNKYIEGVYVDKGNKRQFDVDGVVFDYPTSANPYIKLNYYPQNKKDKAFKIPENARFDDIYNNYLEELTIPKTATFYSDTDIKNLCIKKKTKNLKTIRVQKGSPYTEIIKGTFTGTVIEY